MVEYGQEFEFEFPTIVNIDSIGQEVQVKCERGNEDISNCNTCDIKCEELSGGKYVLTGSYPVPTASTPSDETVSFTVKLSDELGGESVYVW